MWSGSATATRSSPPSGSTVVAGPRWSRSASGSSGACGRVDRWWSKGGRPGSRHCRSPRVGLPWPTGEAPRWRPGGPDVSGWPSSPKRVTRPSRSPTGRQPMRRGSLRSVASCPLPICPSPSSWPTIPNGPGRRSGTICSPMPRATPHGTPTGRESPRSRVPERSRHCKRSGVPIRSSPPTRPEPLSIGAPRSHCNPWSEGCRPISPGRTSKQPPRRRLRSRPS